MNPFHHDWHQSFATLKTLALTLTGQILLSIITGVFISFMLSKLWSRPIAVLKAESDSSDSEEVSFCPGPAMAWPDL